MDEIKLQIREYIINNFLDGEDTGALKDDVSLERTHIVDSARALELILFLEETWGFEVETDDATPENFDTIDAMVAYTSRKLG